MGAKSHMDSSGGFAADLNAYLKKVIADNDGREDLSGRWLESITKGARSYDYWSRIIKDTRAMTTNDIDVLAATFGVSPFEWVENTRRFAAGDPVPVLLFDVAPHEDDYEISADPGDEYGLAAKKRPQPGS